MSGNNDRLVQSHTLPYCLSGGFPSGPHSGFCVAQPHLGNSNSMIASLLQLSDRGAIYQSALAVCREETQAPAEIEVAWSSEVHQLNTDSLTQKPDIGRLGAREMQEVDFRQAYQRIWLFFTLRITLFKPLRLWSRTLFSTRRRGIRLFGRRC